MQQLDADEMVEVTNLRHPEKTENIQGPRQVRLTDPWEMMTRKKKCRTLDADDFLIVRDRDGKKRVLTGAQVYRQPYGEEILHQAQSTQVPVNHYIIINDDDSTTNPVVHIKGPTKWYPEPFQTLVKDSKNNKDYHPCIEVTTKQAIHMQRADGRVELVSKPGYYMPEVGEKVIAYVQRQVLLSNDFCIIKTPNGSVKVRSGENPSDRSFFLNPFEDFLKFNCDGEIAVLNMATKPMPHKFSVRTNDNVLIDLDMRIQYRFDDVQLFASNPIDFYDYVKNHVQNSLLDRFAQVELKEFLLDFGTIADTTLVSTREFFISFGIHIEALLILNYKCVNQSTQELLHSDIHLNVSKQNELRARQNDVLIQEQANEVLAKQKDLEVQMCMKDNELALKRKIMQNTLRMQEMEIEIQEEHKRSELLEVRRGNDVVEAEFEGRSKGHEFSEYLRGISDKLSTKEKIDIYDRKCTLETAKILYEKSDKITLYPHGVDVKTFQTDNEKDADIIRSAYLGGIGLAQGQHSQDAEFKVI